MEREIDREELKRAMAKGDRGRTLKVNTYSLKFPHLVPWSLKQMWELIKRQREK